MENKVFGIQAEYLDELVDLMNKFSKGKKVFATQTHIDNGKFYAFLYYEYDEQLSNEKPSYFKKFNNPQTADRKIESGGDQPCPDRKQALSPAVNSLKPEKNSIPATPNQIWTLINKCNISKEAAEKMTKFEASQIISEKKRGSK